MKNLFCLLFIFMAALFSLSAQVDIEPAYGGGAITMSTDSGSVFCYLDNDNGGGYFYVESSNDPNRSIFWNNGTLFLFGQESSLTLNPNFSGNVSASFPVDAISAPEILDEPGLTHDVDNAGAAYSDTGTVIASTTITTPVDGYVLVMANSELAFFHSTGTNSQVNIGISKTSDLSGAQSQRVGIPNNVNSGLFFMPGAVQAVFEESAGTHTYNYTGNLDAGSNFVVSTEAKITAIFIPTSYGTVEGELQGEDQQSEALASTENGGLTGVEIEEKKMASILANQERIKKELAEMEATIEEYRKKNQEHRKARELAIENQ